MLLRYIPDAMFVKAFNNIFFKHLLSRASRPARTLSARRWPPQRGNRKLAGTAVWVRPCYGPVRQASAGP